MHSQARQRQTALRTAAPAPPPRSVPCSCRRVSATLRRHSWPRMPRRRAGTSAATPPATPATRAEPAARSPTPPTGARSPRATVRHARGERQHGAPEAHQRLLRAIQLRSRLGRSAVGGPRTQPTSAARAEGGPLPTTGAGRRKVSATSAPAVGLYGAKGAPRSPPQRRRPQRPRQHLSQHRHQHGLQRRRRRRRRRRSPC
mmetsp:Transcript_126456/g.393591  ORF Transcript_126456/g.393591 Transcript_126456/m.393591 type:complete len:201 (-) Transcript_126456:143-745(-)